MTFNILLRNFTLSLVENHLSFRLGLGIGIGNISVSCGFNIIIDLQSKVDLLHGSDNELFLVCNLSLHYGIFIVIR